MVENMAIFEENFKLRVADIGEANHFTNKGVLSIMQEIAAMASDQVRIWSK